MSHELPDSSDVTLASKDAQSNQPVCKFHKFGHCKFGQTCRHMHNNSICTNPKCDRKSCLWRHPQSCKYFSNSGFCRFGNECSYLHNESKSTTSQKEIEDLKTLLYGVVQSLATKDKEIQELQERVNTLESRPGDEAKFSCEMCGKFFKSSSTLRNHVLKFHKQEALREDALDNSLELSILNNSRNEDISTSENTNEIIFYKYSEEKFQCMYCDETLKIPELAKHFVNVHQTFSNCPHCEAQIPDEETLLTFHLEVCTTPCPGPPGCPCCKHDVSICKTCKECALEFEAFQS